MFIRRQGVTKTYQWEASMVPEQAFHLQVRKWHLPLDVERVLTRIPGWHRISCRLASAPALWVSMPTRATKQGGSSFPQDGCGDENGRKERKEVECEEIVALLKSWFSQVCRRQPIATQNEQAWPNKADTIGKLVSGEVSAGVKSIMRCPMSPECYSCLGRLWTWGPKLNKSCLVWFHGWTLEKSWRNLHKLSTSPILIVIKVSFDPEFVVRTYLSRSCPTLPLTTARSAWTNFLRLLKIARHIPLFARLHACQLLVGRMLAYQNSG